MTGNLSQGGLSGWTEAQPYGGVYSLRGYLLRRIQRLD